MEHENLKEPSQLPYKFFIDLEENAVPYIGPAYQMDHARTTALIKFLCEAQENGLIEQGPTTWRCSPFMVPRAQPGKDSKCV